MPTVPLPPIDQVELMLISVGLKVIISREVETITKAKLKEMARIPDEIQTLARKLCKGEIDETYYPEFNWRKAVKELAKGWDLEQVAEMVAKFPHEYQAVGSALVLKSKDLIADLLADFPISKYQTLSGDIDLRPADQQLFRFISKLEMIDNPLAVFSFMANGSLLKSQAAVIHKYYPTLSIAIDAAIWEAIVANKATKKSFELPPGAEYGVKSWFGTGPIDPARISSAQKTVAQANATTKNPSNPSPPNPRLSKDLLTKAQGAASTN